MCALDICLKKLLYLCILKVLPRGEGVNQKVITMTNKLLCNVFALVMMTAALSSCEKMVVSDQSEKAIPEDANVVLKVSQFEQISFDGQTRAEVGTVCTRLNFDVYDENGEKVDYLNQKSEDSNFGVASFSLPEGHYYIVVVGHCGSKNPSFYANGKISITGKELGDTFWNCEELEVGTERVQKNVALKRIVAMLRFIPNDDLPSTANWMRFSYKGSRGTFSGYDGYGTTNAKQNVEMDVVSGQNQFEFYMIPQEDQEDLTVEVVTKHVDGSIIDNLAEKTIEGVPVRRNCITICRGNLFDNENTSGSVYITITVDDTWGESLNMTF